MEILCFFAGIALIYTKSLYPLLIVIISLVLRPRHTAILAFLAAVIWGALHLGWSNESGMPTVRVLPKVRLQGIIGSLPLISAHKTQFEFIVQQINDQKAKAIVLLSCYQHCPSFKAGQQWRFEAKLKQPENLANPGYYDYVSSLAARHIHWVGYIKQATPLDQNAQPKSLLVMRENLALLWNQSITDQAVLGIAQALTLGVASNIDKQHWDLFRRTGVTHLMVISGSHIGLIVGFCYWLMRWMWSRSSRLSLYCPATKPATAVGMLMGLIYALLAGFAPPSQRSLLACFFLLLRNFLSVRFTVWQAWRYGLLIVLLYEPHTVLLPGFYLSFLAVAILILINQRFEVGVIKKAVYVQLACLIGLIPLSLYWFSYGAITGLLANALAIPWVGFVVVPLALLSLCLQQFFDSSLLTVPVRLSIEWLLIFLQWVDSFSTVNLDFSFTVLLFPLALMLAMLMMLFLPIKALYPALAVLILCSFFPAYPRMKLGHAKIDILDVGQGLAVAIHTAKHVLIYDTGVKFYQGSDMGTLALIPYLTALGIKKIDAVVISHPDLDHRGGLVSLEQKYPISTLLVDNPSFYRRGTSCHRYPSWQWDGVSFRFLAIRKKLKGKNNGSCILQIENQAGKVILTGDIEKLAENYLLKRYGKQLRSEVLLVPHHGSKTSSSLAFIKQVAPQYAIISSGFDNRYHFPHAQTLATLQKLKIAIFNTAECGMVSIELQATNKLTLPVCYKTSELLRV